MLTRRFVSVANHLLTSADWATERLKVHAGKQASLLVGLWKLHVRIDRDGFLLPGDPGAPSEVTLDIPPPALARWIAQRDAATRDIGVSGDAEFAAALSFVAANIQWDFEEDLSRVTGDVAAHRIGQAVHSLGRWPARVGESVRANIAEYLTEEKRVLPTRLQAEEFLQAVDELRDAAERLEKRIARLEQSRSRS